MTVKRIVANMLAAEPGRAKPFHAGIFDMDPIMDHGWIEIYAAHGDPAGPQLGFAGEGDSSTSWRIAAELRLWRRGGEAGRAPARSLF